MKRQSRTDQVDTTGLRTQKSVFGAARAARRVNQAVSFETFKLEIKSLVERLNTHEIINAPCNRDVVWPIPKQRAFLVSCFEGIVPVDMLMRRRDVADDDDDSDDNIEMYQHEVFDGNNRLTALQGFIAGKFSIPVSEGIYYHYNKLPVPDRNFLDKMQLPVTVMSNCDEDFAIRYTGYRNEGTAMSIGEQLGLIRRSGSTHADYLDRCYSSLPCFRQAKDRGSGIKTLALIIQNLEQPSEEVHYVEHHFEAISNFFRGSGEFSTLDPDETFAVLKSIDDLCVEGAIPPAICLSCPTSTCAYFFAAIIALVIASTRFETVRISATTLVQAAERVYQVKLKHGAKAVNTTIEILDNEDYNSSD